VRRAYVARSYLGWRIRRLVRPITPAGRWMARRGGSMVYASTLASLRACLRRITP